MDSRHQGNVTKILECVPLSQNEDIDRFTKFLDEMIAEKKLPEYKKYDSTKKKIKKLKDENDEWEDYNKNEDFNKLVKQIALKNKTNFESYFDHLEQKYGAEDRKKKIKNKEIDEEEFQEIQKKIVKKKGEGAKNLKRIKK